MKRTPSLSSIISLFTELLANHPVDLSPAKVKQLKRRRLAKVAELIRTENVFTDIENGRLSFMSYDEWYARLDRFRGHKKNRRDVKPVTMSSAAMAGDSSNG
jgi:hypothetical protein